VTLALPTVQFQGPIASSKALQLKWLLPTLKYTALGLIIVALARPQWGTRQMNILTEGINIVLAVDLSESMAALDFKRDNRIVNRLEAVKGVVRSFISNRAGDRIGLVVFGTQAYTQIPLTRDHNTIVSILERLQIGAAGKSTAIGDAIGISLKRLEDIQSKSNIIILLTDGRSNAGELTPEAATEIASHKKVKIYTIGVGSRGEVPFLVKHPVFGDRYVYQRVDIDEETLQEIAQQTEGQYFRAEDLKDLEGIYATIDALEKTEVKVKSFAEYREYYFYLLIPAFVCLGLWIILRNTRYLSIP
jgi:Ca-activated chloride channel family protein